MEDQWLVIVNPAAGSGKTGRTWPAIQSELDESGILYKHVFTSAPGDAVKLVKSAYDKGQRLFISVGGDGTHHEITNGICKACGDNSDCTLGIIPIGTGNDWARSLGIPNKRSEAIQLISGMHTIPHGVGKVTFESGYEEFFMNVAGMSLDAEVVRTISADLVKKLGGLAYLVGGVKQFITYKPSEAIIQIDGTTKTGNFLTMHAGFGQYCGGGMQFLPHAGASSEQMAITTILPSTILGMLTNIPSLFFGSIIDIKQANSYHATRFEVKSASDQQIPIEADGEFLGFSSFVISAQPKAFHVCVDKPRKAGH